MQKRQYSDKKLKDKLQKNSERQNGIKSREEKSQLNKEYWTEHRITLISLQMQYIRNKKPEESEMEEQVSTSKKKNPKKKIDLEYETGFLFAHKQNSGNDINIIERIKTYKYLNQLFDTPIENMSSIDDLQLRQFVKIMLQLKHECILDQFLLIYDWIIQEILALKFSMIEKEEDRSDWLIKTHDIVRNNIEKYTLKTPYFSQYLKTDRKQTEKLLKATIYCFMAEKYNFNINQYYSQAFSVTFTEKKKKVKPDSKNYDEMQS